MTDLLRYAQDNSFLQLTTLPIRLFSGVKACARIVASWHAAYKLKEMNDCLLSDIGIDRHDVRTALKCAWRESPTLHLARIAAERRAVRLSATQDRHPRNDPHGA